MKTVHAPRSARLAPHVKAGIILAPKALQWLNRGVEPPSRCDVLALITAFVVGSLGEANAALIYDNGPIMGQLAYNIDNNGAFAVSDSFTTSGPATLTSAQAGLWVANGPVPAVPVSANWRIGTTAGGSEIASGLANFANTPLGNGIYASTFEISGNLSSAGTYYLTLLNGIGSNGQALFWDSNDGPSTAYQFGGYGVITSESFQIYGEVVPEPSAGVLLLVTFGLQCIRNMRNRKP